MPNRLQRLLNRNLPEHVTIDYTVAWPLLVWPLLLIGQLLTPHPIWVTLLVVIMGLYVFGYWWVHELARGLDLLRARKGTLLVAGDRLQEEFTLVNPTRFPVIWAEFNDYSDVPDYDPGLVVSAGASSNYRWRTSVECRRRGVFHLGPSRLLTGDIFGLFTLTFNFSHAQQILIYPRVLQLPAIALPRGQAGGEARRRRPLAGTAPAATVRDYFPGDAVRDIHWRATAHRGELMVREVELEPSGDVWIILDLNAATHSGVGDSSTLEYAIVLAASLTATLLGASERRAVGLLAVSGGVPSRKADAPVAPARDEVAAMTAAPLANEVDLSPDAGLGLHAVSDGREALWVPPQSGQAQLWQVLAALAPAESTDLSLADLLRRSGPALGYRRTLIVITADLSPHAADKEESDRQAARADWTAELMRLQARGLASSVLLVSAAEADGGPVSPTLNDVSQVEQAQQLRRTLAQVDIPVQVLPVDAKLPPLLTYRRMRTVVRSTPTGGVVTYEVEEEVG